MFLTSEVCAFSDGMIRSYKNTNELKVLKFEETIRGLDNCKWLEILEDDFFRFEKNDCFKPVERKDINLTCSVMISD